MVTHYSLTVALRPGFHNLSRSAKRTVAAYGLSKPDKPTAMLCARGILAHCGGEVASVTVERVRTEEVAVLR